MKEVIGGSSQSSRKREIIKRHIDDTGVAEFIRSDSGYWISSRGVRVKLSPEAVKALGAAMVVEASARSFRTVP